uniref:Uncharacterized protein n=1 Tax=viral metagenome TaxID=1070528 RepID=A0A6H2A2I0_9ZZZZ
MGFWKSGRGINGDSWADEMGRCMKALSKDVLPRSKKDEGNPIEAHEFTMEEFADLVEFCSRGHLIVEVRYPERNGSRPLSELHNWGVETYPNRGQIHCPELCEV